MSKFSEKNSEDHSLNSHKLDYNSNNNLSDLKSNSNELKYNLTISSVNKFNETKDENNFLPNKGFILPIKATLKLKSHTTDLSNNLFKIQSVKENEFEEENDSQFENDDGDGERLFEKRTTLKSKISNYSISSNDRFPAMTLNNNLKSLSNLADFNGIRTPSKNKTIDNFSNNNEPKLQNSYNFRNSNQQSQKKSLQIYSNFGSKINVKVEENPLDVIKIKNSILPHDVFLLQNTKKFKSSISLNNKNITKDDTNTLVSNRNLNDIYKDFFDPSSKNHAFDKIYNERNKLRSVLNQDMGSLKNKLYKFQSKKVLETSHSNHYNNFRDSYFNQIQKNKFGTVTNFNYNSVEDIVNKNTLNTLNPMRKTYSNHTIDNNRYGNNNSNLIKHQDFDYNNFRTMTKNSNISSPGQFDYFHYNNAEFIHNNVSSKREDRCFISVDKLKNEDSSDENEEINNEDTDINTKLRNIKLNNNTISNSQKPDIDSNNNTVRYTNKKVSFKTNNDENLNFDLDKLRNQIKSNKSSLMIESNIKELENPISKRKNSNVSNKLSNTKLNNQDNTDSKSNIIYDKNYCPHCQHCNSKILKDENLIKHIGYIKEAKNIINKYALFILQSNVLDEKNQNLFSELLANNIEMEDANGKKGEFPIFMEAKNIKYNSKYVEEKLSQIPKVQISSKNSRLILSNVLEALIEKKDNISNLLENEVKLKFESCLISKGEIFNLNTKNLLNLFGDENKDKKNEEVEKKINSELVFDEEIFSLMDETTINSIKELVKKRIFESDEFKLNENEVIKEKNESKEKFLVLFLVFIQILAEISTEDKSRAVLLYKFFKYYFLEQDKKWIIQLKEMKSKVKYYKTLAKIIIQQKNKHLKHIEEISEVLVSNRPTAENLKKHKELIQKLIAVVNEKRDEIYILNSEISTLKKEINFWIFDFDGLKVDKELREKLATLNKEKIIKSINREIGHRNLSKNVHSLVANADIFLLLSGQRKYFFDQKEYYRNEIDKITNSNCKLIKESDELKSILCEKTEEIFTLNKKYQVKIDELRAKLSVDKICNEVQTEINLISMNEILKNNNNYLDLKKLNEPKIIEIYDSIIYNCSKEKPISKGSLMKLIPEIYGFKFEKEMNLSDFNSLDLTLADIFLNFFRNQFQIVSLANEKMESTIKSVLMFCSEDSRIDLFRRLLGIGLNPISQFISEKYFIILKCKIFIKLFLLTL